MTKFEQAAKEYTELIHEKSLHTTADLRVAFTAGATHGSKLFAEWIRKNYFLKGEWWENAAENRYTTSELYQLWQQSL